MDESKKSDLESLVTKLESNQEQSCLLKDLVDKNAVKLDVVNMFSNLLQFAQVGAIELDQK